MLTVTLGLLIQLKSAMNSLIHDSQIRPLKHLCQPLGWDYSHASYVKFSWEYANIPDKILGECPTAPY
jgi:hypothetical protein